MANLTQEKCEACEGKEQPLSEDEAKKYLSQVPGWEMDPGAQKIYRRYTTENFMEAVRYINKVADVAESENHHPDIHLTGYKNLFIEISTHAIKGLSKNDFILAAKINELPVKLKEEKNKC